MSDDHDALPGDIAALLRDERSYTDVPGQSRARLAARVAAAVPSFGSIGRPAVAGKVAAAGTAGVIAKIVVTLVLAGGVALVGMQVRGQPSAPRSQPVAAQAVPGPTGGIEIATSRVERADVAPVTGSAAALHALAVPSSAPAITSEASLREEERLLRIAHEALAAGDPEGALAPTAQHAARFPHGALTEERLALRIRALAQLGRNEEATALVVKMRSDYPRSFLLEGAERDVHEGAVAR